MNRELWEKCVAFHGHECPGLAIGFKASQAAVEIMDVNYSEDEELVCITENDACGVDAIQVLTGCSFGKGNLIYRGTGKHAFSFFNRKTNEKIRLVLKPFQGEMERKERQMYILNASIGDIFDVKTPSFDIPEKARIFTTLVCESCHEGAPEHKMRIQNGQRVCLDCFDDYSRGW